MHVAAAEPATTEGSQQEQNDRMIRMFVRSFFLDLCDDADKEELKQFGKKALDQAIEELKTDLHGTHPVSAEKFVDYMEGYTKWRQKLFLVAPRCGRFQRQGLSGSSLSSQESNRIRCQGDNGCCGPY
jgi:hypothetical protein